MLIFYYWPNFERVWFFLFQTLGMHLLDDPTFLSLSAKPYQSFSSRNLYRNMPRKSIYLNDNVVSKELSNFIAL